METINSIKMKKTTKKTIIITLIIALTVCLLVSGVIYELLFHFFDLPCPFTYIGWQTIEIENCGMMKIPPEWQYAYDEGKIYIFKDGEPAIIQGTEKVDYWTDGTDFYDKYYGDYTCVEIKSREYPAPGSYIGTNKYMYNGEIIERYYLLVGYEPRKQFIIWDTSISYKQLKDIAKSFERTDI